MFDVIFVDGLHVYEQVYKDIINSLKFLNKNGYIICHDMNPPTEKHQAVPRPTDQGQWNGDCWKAWIQIRTERNDLTMHVVDMDWGVGVVKKGKQLIYDKTPLDTCLTWEYFDENIISLLNKK